MRKITLRRYDPSQIQAEEKPEKKKFATLNPTRPSLKSIQRRYVSSSFVDEETKVAIQPEEEND